MDTCLATENLPLYLDERVMYGNDCNFGGGLADKGKMKLNLEGLPKKKGADVRRGNTECMLTTPDLNMLQLASPELERLIIEQHGAVTTPAPSGCFLRGDDVCKHERRSDYAQGLATAYEIRKRSNSGANGPEAMTFSTNPRTSITTAGLIAPLAQRSDVSAFTNYANMANQANTMIKDEKPQTVPVASIGISQIDLEEQEWVKKERKRERNRLAASRCRKRKLEKEKDLQDRVKDLKFENGKLNSTVDTLRKEICSLKEQILQHVGAGCRISLPRN